MSAARADLTFEEMLDANRLENAKWQSWFERQPAEVLELPLSIAGMKNVRELLLHILAVELRYAERLSGLPITQYDQVPTSTIAGLFGAGTQAHELYRAYLARATDEDLARVIEFPTRSAGVLRASERKVFAHAMLHSMRHWAQLATALREAGHPTDWGHDFLFSSVFE